MQINIGLTDILRISPMIILFLASLIPITIKVLKGNKEQSPMSTLAQGIGGVVLAGVLLFVFSGSGDPAFYKALVFDGVTLWMGLIALGATIGAMALAYENPSTNGNQFSEWIFLILNSAIGMLILISALDLLVVFIGLELMSLSLYLMIAMSHEEKLAKEAAFKYFILGSFASAIYLYGVSFIFGSSGTTYISEILGQTEALITTSRTFLFGLTMVIVGFCFKVSIAPFHAWTPDVYQGAPTPLSSYMATAIKAASFAAFLRVISLKGVMFNENLLDVMQWLAVITMLVGNLAAIRQENFKRMLAYSSIAHSGYLLVGLITAGISSEGAFGASSVIFYLFGYALMTLGAFAIVSLFEASENSSLNIEDMGGFAKNHPIMALSLTVFLLSMAGLPPTLGFFGKFYMFTAAIGEGLLWLAFWAMINSVISAYYYLRPIVVMYMKEGSATVAPQSLNASQLTIIISVIAIALLGVVSNFIFKAVETSLL